MKENLIKRFIPTLFLFFLLLGNHNIYSQNDRCTIYFKDNTSVEGLGKVKVDGNIKFRVNEDSESVIYEPTLIDKLKIQLEGKTKTYQYIKIKNDIPFWAEIVLKGKVNLYKTNSQGYSDGPFRRPVTTYFVLHDGEKEAFKITAFNTMSKNFKNAASEFFKDCPALVEKVNTKTFKKDDIEKVVNFYNKNCGHTESTTTLITN